MLLMVMLMLKLPFHHLAMPFRQLILWKIIKVSATRCHILRLKCTKFYFGWGSAVRPRPRWEFFYSTVPQTY